MTEPTQQSGQDWLMGGGGHKSASFPTVGTTIRGTVTETPVLRDVTAMGTGEIQRWPDGTAKKQLLVSLQTGDRDPADPADDGVRTLYVKGYMKNAVQDAVKDVGAPGLEIGGTLTVTYTSDGTSTTRGHNPPKLYSAAYASPNPSAEFLGAGQPSVPSGANEGPRTHTAGQPFTQPAQTNEPWRLTDEQKASLTALGVDPALAEADKKRKYEEAMA